MAIAIILMGPPRALAADASAADPYRLGAGDRVAVSVLGRSDLSGDFVVDASGQIALPLIGLVRGEGTTTQELQDLVTERFAQAMGSETAVRVDIAEFRPFYILGNVRAPGAYPYVPRMSVLHAIALAGGDLVVDQRAYQFVQDGASAREEIAVLKRRRDSLLARRALLEAEQQGDDQIDFPDDLEARAEMAGILDKEREIFRTRANAMKQEIQLLERQAEVFDEEIEALLGQREALEQQIRLVEDDIAHVRDLVRRNLAPRPRLIEQQKERAELDRENRELGAFLARARQGKVNALESVKHRRAEQLRDIAVELQNVHHELDQVAIELAGARERAALASASLEQERAASQRPSVSRYVIIRKTDAGRVMIEAGPLTPLQPDDLLQVQIADGFEMTAPLREAAGANASTQAPLGAGS